MRFKEFLAEAAAPAVKIGLDFELSVPVVKTNLPDEKASDTFKTAADFAAMSLARALGEDVSVKMSSGARSKSKWLIQPSDNADPKGYHGIEIISPLMHPDVAMRAAGKVATWMDENEAKTADADSVRIAIEVKGIKDKLDPVKLVMFLDAPGAEAAFAKQLKGYSPAIVEIMLQKVKHSGKLTDTAEDLHKSAMSYLGKRADGYTNFGNMDDDLVEFRVGGGAGYEHNMSAITKKAYKLARAVELATDPANERAEYLKRLTDLFADARNTSVTKNEKNLPPEVYRLYKYDPEVLTAWKRYEADSEHGHARTPLLVLINKAMAAAKSQNTSLNSAEIGFFKKLLRKSTAQSDDVDQYYGHDHISRLKFKKDFAL